MGEVIRFPTPPKPPWRAAGGYVPAVAMVATATACALAAERLLATRDLAVIFVLPVLVAGLGLGRGPAVAAAVLSVLADDLFLIEPRLSLAVASRADVWTLILLLAVGCTASEVASRSRQRALQAERERARAQALLDLAGEVLGGASESVIHRAAADALFRTCGAPSLVADHTPSGEVRVLASAGAAVLADADHAAVAWSLDTGHDSHAQSFPFDGSSFDVWPVQLRFGGPLALAALNADGDPLLRDERAPYVRMVTALVATVGRPRPLAVTP